MKTIMKTLNNHHIIQKTIRFFKPLRDRSSRGTLHEYKAGGTVVVLPLGFLLMEKFLL
jgi:hypothetical protein